MKYYRTVLICLSLFFCASWLSAKPADKAFLIEKAVQRAAVQASRDAVQADADEPGFVALSKKKQAQFDKMLAAAVAVVDEEGLETNDLGVALEYWLPTSMVYAKEAAAGEDAELPSLTESEERAALYAVNALIPAEYRKNSRYTKEYMEQHPVTDWAQYRKDCAWAMNLLYDAVQAIAEREPNFQYTILMVLTH